MRMNSQCPAPLQRTARKQRTSRKQRQGAVLLVVLSMLFMFTIMVLTYVMVTSRYRQASKMYVQAEQRNEDPEIFANRSLLQMIRGSRDDHSPLFGQDFLGDVYGDDGVAFRIMSAWIPNAADVRIPSQPPQGQGHLLLLGIRRENAAGNLVPGYFKNKAEMDFGGRVVTIEGDSEFSEASSRTLRFTKVFDGQGAVGTDNLGAQAYVVVRMFDVPTSVEQERVKSVLKTGESYDPNAPGTTGYFAGHFLWMNGAAFADTSDPSGNPINEPYDAADERNMLLSHRFDLTGRIIPSMHRPALISYEFNKLSAAQRQDPAQLMTFFNKYSARPVPMYYGNIRQNFEFTGSHSDYESHGAFNLENPVHVKNLLSLLIGVDHKDASGNTVVETKWDVDNTGSGTPDSIWIDPQFPVMSTRDGRRYKILISPLVHGLDGGVNVNVAGNWMHIATGNVPPGTIPEQSTLLAQGRGYGPAEINLGPFLGSKKEIATLLLKRYGKDLMPGSRSNYSRSADLFIDDQFVQFFQTGLPARFGPPGSGQGQFFGLRSSPSAYGTPPDVYGRGIYALTYAGHPVNLFAGKAYDLTADIDALNFSAVEFAKYFDEWPVTDGQGNQSGLWLDERTENPYQLDLLHSNPNDKPFTFAELEQVLRSKDLDVSLQDGRLDNLASRGGEITTHSYEIPPMKQFRGRSLAEIIRQRVRVQLKIKKQMAGIMPEDPSDQELDEVLRDILPFEMFRGSPLNINRLFGNGRDDAPFNKIVDEVNEIFDPSSGTSETLYRYFQRDVKPWYANGDDPRLGRDRLARHIYCLLMATVPNTPPNANITRPQWLAQLAVNMVDFRDADATMTMFEYDTNPFDGWDVDGVNDPHVKTPEAQSGIVIGMEHPDLLLTESLVTHDRRVRDTGWDDSNPPVMAEDPQKKRGPNGDRDLDQYRIPQGSWFFELFCPRNRLSEIEFNTNGVDAEDSVPPGDLYDNASGRLDLGRMLPASPPNTLPAVLRNQTRPVWRVVVAPNNDAVALNNPMGVPLLDNMTIDEDEILREVWFNPRDPIAMGVSPRRAARIYYGTATSSLAPGEYAVVGPRPVTYFGSPRNNAATPTYVEPAYGVVLNNGTFTKRFGYQPTPPIQGGNLEDSIRSVPIIVAGNSSPDWNRNVRVGLSLTEPLPFPNLYYPEPTDTLPGYPEEDSYYSYAQNDNDRFPDVPFDQRSPPAAPANPPYNGPLVDGKPITSEDSRPLYHYDMLRTKTYVAGVDNNYGKAAYLQRVVDPTQPWHPNTNPYITVDWIDLDVTVFNGEDKNHNQGWASGGNFDNIVAGGRAENNYATQANINAQIRFEARKKSNANGQIWTAITRLTAGNVGSDPNYYFGYPLLNSLGYLNDHGGDKMRPGGQPGFGERISINDAVQLRYLGTPKANPVPWLGWNDRPYNSVMELLSVPTSSPSRFLVEFRGRNGGATPYSDSTSSEFGHLFNWFFTDTNRTAQDFFEFVEVPSPFLGTQELINPFDMQASNSSTVFNESIQWLRPPFNTISNFRNPGKVNVNSAPSSRVWNAITWGSRSGTAWNWDEFVKERRGYDEQTPNIGTVADVFDDATKIVFSASISPDHPTEFHGVFSSSLTDGPKPEERSFLRPDDNGARPRYANADAEAYRNTARNAPYRYHAIQRLKNLTTTQSNVYAIWITVGYFEVKPPNSPGGSANPDRYELGQEIGADDGSIERPRFFYIIDRSIPVGYAPGEDLNVENVIRLQRRID